MSDLNDRRIIVTGAAGGIGAALVRAFVEAGANVVAMDVGSAIAASAEAANELGPGNAHGVVCDVGNRASVFATFAAATKRLGGLNVLVHAAGVELKAAAEDITEADWDLMLNVNAKGTMFTNQAAFATMKTSGGAILNFASGAGVRGYELHGHYAASKGAVLSWTRSISKEWGQYGITANSVCPGMRTPMYETTRASYTPEELIEHDASLARTTPIDGKQGDPTRDLAPFMVFMASEGARFITGQTLVVDGGRTQVR
jgi:NAD(P)-dependent dehydrogenase (short-subunit alcohol dehydrogenase family)